MSLINVSNLTFSYEGSYDNIFENVSFQIDTDWKLGFIGRNGRGKTTFLNLLLGKYEFSGHISSTAKFEYFPYSVEDKHLNTIDVMKTICTECMDWEIFREISLLDIQEDVLYRPFNTLSNGEQTKVLLAALFLKSSCFLLLDEPTNHLDIETRNVVKNYLKQKKGFILVSHDRNLLDKCVDHILSINKTNIEIQKGNFTSWWENKKLQDNFELAENKKLLNQIERLSHAAKRSASWANKVERSKYGKTNSGLKLDKGYVGHKAAKAMKRAKNIESRQQQAIARKSELLHNIEEYDDLKISPLDFYKGCLIEANNLSLFYGNKKVCSNLNFGVNIGDRIAIIGKNGSGKTSILKLINGDDVKYTGNLNVASGLRISYIPQDISYLKGNLTEFAYHNRIDETQFKTILRKLDFNREQFDKNIEDFSSGQKKKVLIAKSLCESAHLYIWDEPLNYIDIFSRIQIEKMILEYCPTLLFVEHDEAFRNNICTKSINLNE
jgi:lincosamide and streptogramin A transport system ATP-binding/permease protein